MFALVNAGASLIPSPTIATSPFLRSLRTTASLPSGSTPAITSSTPACSPMAFAVRSLSPVSMTTRIPISFNSRMASALSSFITSATAIIPCSTPSFANNSGVFPSSASFSARSIIVALTSDKFWIYIKLPPTSFAWSATRTASSPLPGSA